MKLNGGILIIGSLVWDDSTIRKNWRNQSLNEKDRIKVRIPIRYGRISQSRMNTYTMVFSPALAQDEYGQGILLKFRNPIVSTDALINEADTIIRVERDKTKEGWKAIRDANPIVLNWNWGVLGLCINPKHLKNNVYSEEVNGIVNLWRNCLSNFDSSIYSVKGENSFIDVNGIFKVDWNQEMENIDFFVSTVIQPNVEKTYPDGEQIALKMYEGKYYSYFINNIENGITTKDDPVILKLLKEKYSISSYIEDKISKK